MDTEPCDFYPCLLYYSLRFEIWAGAYNEPGRLIAITGSTVVKARFSHWSNHSAPFKASCLWSDLIGLESPTGIQPPLRAPPLHLHLLLLNLREWERLLTQRWFRGQSEHYSYQITVNNLRLYHELHIILIRLWFRLALWSSFLSLITLLQSCAINL